MSPGRLMLALAVWLLLWPAKLVASAVPTRYLSRVLGTDAGIAGDVAPITPREARRASRLADAIALATRYVVFGGPCYAQALIVHLLLGVGGIGHTVFFGVRRMSDSGELEAHAWVLAGDIAVSGGECIADYTVVRCFVSA